MSISQTDIDFAPRRTSLSFTASDYDKLVADGRSIRIWAIWIKNNTVLLADGPSSVEFKTADGSETIIEIPEVGVGVLVEFSQFKWLADKGLRVVANEDDPGGTPPASDLSVTVFHD